jgi:hypothetical protein
MAGIRLGSGESARASKGIICADISEFESYMASHAVGLHELTFPERRLYRAPMRRMIILVVRTLAAPPHTTNDSHGTSAG